MTWTEKDKETVRDLWTSGESAAFIADKFHSTRSAVCGLAHRNGWVTPNKPRSEPRKPTERAPRQVPLNILRAAQRRASPAPQPPLEPDPEPTVDDLAIPLEQRKTLLQLTEKTCHWPIGSPVDGNLFFCGAAPLEEQSYCAAHYRRSVQAPTPRRSHSFSLVKMSVRL